MRDLKFRALCEVDTNKGKETKMVYFSHCELDNGLWFKPDDDNIHHINEWLTKPLQFTDLKDKNGNEIYEGDIIDVLNKHETYSKVKIIVTFEDGSFCLREHGRQEFHRCVGFRQNKVHGEAVGKSPIYEVIGNIHENKNLLEQ